MHNLTKFYIGGQWVEPLSSATLPILNPATEAQIGTVAMGNAADADRAVAAAKAAFTGFSTTPKQERLDLLHRLKAATERRFEDLGPAPVSFRSFESDTRHQGDRIWQRHTATSLSGMRFA